MPLPILTAATACALLCVRPWEQGSGHRVYKSVREGLTSIVRVEGVRGLYAGLLPSLLKDCPYSALYLLLYTQCKSALSSWRKRWQRLGDGEDRSHYRLEADSRTAGLGRTPLHVEGQTPLIQFTAAFAAASLATSLFQPLEVLKTRLQLPSAHRPSMPSSRPPALTGLTALARQIALESGARGFYRGLLPRVLRRSLSNAIAWSLYEQIYHFWSGQIAV